MRHLEAARGHPFASHQATGMERGSEATAPGPAHYATCASYGLIARATAPFRGVGTPDGCCTAPGMLALRLLPCMGPPEEAAGLLLPCRTWTAGAASSSRRAVPALRPMFLQAQSFTSSRLWRGGPCHSPPLRGRASCASWPAQRLSEVHRPWRHVSGLEPGGPAWPRCVSRRRGGARGLP